MDLTPGHLYRFQTSDNRVAQFGRFIIRVDDTYIFNVNGIETSYHINTLLGMQPRAIGFDDMFVHVDDPIGGKMHGKSRNRNRRKQRKSRKNSKK
jgi:hypothetical protein